MPTTVTLVWVGSTLLFHRQVIYNQSINQVYFRQKRVYLTSVAFCIINDDAIRYTHIVVLLVFGVTSLKTPKASSFQIRLGWNLAGRVVLQLSSVRLNIRIDWRNRSSDMTLYFQEGGYDVISRKRIRLRHFKCKNSVWLFFKYMLNKKPSYCWESRSYCIVSNSRATATCRRWLFQRWKFWWFACSQ